MVIVNQNTIVLSGEVMEIASEVAHKFVKIISHPDHIIFQSDQVGDLTLGDKVKIEINYFVEKIEHKINQLNTQ